MNPKFEVQMNPKYMFHFMVYHNYTRLSGIFSLMMGIVGLAIGIINAMALQYRGTVLGFFVAVVSFVFVPVSIKGSAKRQVAQVKAFQKPLEYELTEEGVMTRQDEAEALTKWEEFQKVVSTGSILILYITRVRAIIFPKECMGQQYPIVVETLKKYMSDKRVKVK